MQSALRNKWGGWFFAGCLAVVVGATGWYVAHRGQVVVAAALDRPTSNDEVAVEVITPRSGGIDRVCLQPGSVEPLEFADLYTKVSGFLSEQKVDIGYKVKAGDVLARISAPEHEKQVVQDAAEVTRARAKVDQMKAAITTTEAELGAAGAAVALAEAEKKGKRSYRVYREKQRDRMKELVARMAVEARLADEHEDQYLAALSAELAATEATGAARQREAAARARVEQAKSDFRYAQAEEAVAVARLEKSQVLLEYTVIRSPYTGVITKRNFHVGDFVRSADTGGERIPVLAVERTDVMRVVIQVPERDVPFVDCGDPAVVMVDALPGMVLRGDDTESAVVSRIAASEDPHTRMMRTEVHVKNPAGQLRRGMFGRVALTLQTGAAEALRIPSAALVGKADGKKGIVRVVRNAKVSFVPVTYGADNGAEVEVLSGLTATEPVIVHASGPLEEGSAVAIKSKSHGKGN